MFIHNFIKAAALAAIVFCGAVCKGNNDKENILMYVETHVETPFKEEAHQDLLEYAEFLWNVKRSAFWSFLKNPQINYSSHFPTTPKTFEIAHRLHLSLASLQSHSVPSCPATHPQCSNFATADHKNFYCTAEEIKQNMKGKPTTFYCGDILTFKDILLPFEDDGEDDFEHHHHHHSIKFISNPSTFSMETEKMITLQGYDLLMELKNTKVGNWTDEDEQEKSLQSFGLWIINKVLRAKNQHAALKRLSSHSSTLGLSLKEFKADKKGITDIVRNLSNAIPATPDAQQITPEAILTINGLLANPSMLSLHSLVELNTMMAQVLERVHALPVFQTESRAFAQKFIRETMPFLFEERFSLPDIKVSPELMAHFNPVNLNDLEVDKEYQSWDRHQVSIATMKQDGQDDGKLFKVALNLVKLTIFVGPQVTKLPQQLLLGLQKILNDLLPIQVSLLFMTPQQSSGAVWKAKILESQASIPLRFTKVGKATPEMKELMEKIPILGSGNEIVYSVNGDYLRFDSLSFYNSILSLYDEHVKIISFGLRSDEDLIKPDRVPSKVRYGEVRQKLAASLLPSFFKKEMQVFADVLMILRDVLLTPGGFSRTSLLVGQAVPASVAKAIKQRSSVAHIHNKDEDQLLSVCAIVDPILNSVQTSTLSGALLKLGSEVQYSILFRHHPASYVSLAKAALIPGLKTVNQVWGQQFDGGRLLGDGVAVALMPQAPPAWQLISASDAVDVDNYVLSASDSSFGGDSVNGGDSQINGTSSKTSTKNNSSKTKSIPFSMNGWILEGRLSTVGGRTSTPAALYNKEIFSIPGILLHCSHAPSPTRTIGPLGYFQFPIDTLKMTTMTSDISVSFGIDVSSDKGMSENQEKIKRMYIDRSKITSIVENQCSVQFEHDNTFSPPSLIAFSNNNFKAATENNNKAKKKTKKNDVINIFSIASGKDYERLIKIMSRSVMEGASRDVKVVFNFVANDLTPSFGKDMQALCAEWGCEYRALLYRWPSYLSTKQWRKHRTIWAEKILFLDTFFPEINKVSKILYVDADQVMRADPQQYFEYPLNGNVFGMVPFCSGSILARKETEEFRFWEKKDSYWAKVLDGRPYFISALFVVDMAQWHREMAGEALRSQYSVLTRNPSSLNQLDQDLPNMMQDQLPITELPANWLWCESWCTDASKDNAASIDLCGNPLKAGGSSGSKLDEGARIISEWTLYDREIGRILSKVSGAGDVDEREL